MSEPQWERQVLEKLATAALTEQRRTRQWKLFFRLVWVLLAILLLLADITVQLLSHGGEMELGVVTALVGGPFFLYLILRTRSYWS